MRDGKIHREAHQNRDCFGGPYRESHKARRDHDGDRRCRDSDNAGADETRVVTQAELAAGLGGERRERVHHIGAGVGDEPGRHVRDNQ